MSLIAAAAGLAAGALGAAGLGRLREHRAAPRGLSDLLGWGFLVGEGVVLMKDGSFLAAWRVRGRDLASSTAAVVVVVVGVVHPLMVRLSDADDLLPQLLARTLAQADAYDPLPPAHTGSQKPGRSVPGA